MEYTPTAPRMTLPVQKRIVHARWCPWKENCFTGRLRFALYNSLSVYQHGGQSLPQAVQRCLVEPADGVRALLPVLGHLDGFPLGQHLKETGDRGLKGSGKQSNPESDFLTWSFRYCARHARSASVMPARRSRSRTMRPAMAMGRAPPVSEASTIFLFSCWTL